MKKPVIICVDDEKVVLISLKEQLKRAFGNAYGVETSENGDDALDLCEELAEDGIDIPLVISDYLMPGMKGDELLIRIHALFPRMLKILLTGQASTEGITNSLNNANLYRYIAKPWEQDDLILTVTEAVRSYFQDQRIRDQNEKLRISEEKYRSIFENSVQGIYQTTPEGRILSANPAMASILGYDSPEELMSLVTDLASQSYVNPKDRETFARVLAEKGQVVGFEVRQYRKDGVPVWLSLTSRCVRDRDGRVLYYEGSMVDITERKKREAAEREREAAEAVNRKIMESIHYAKMIQDSLLPNLEQIRTHLPHSFFIWDPKDVVGGDIYFAEVFEQEMIIAVIDCTGHGVPGAFMTMIASSGLKRVIKDEGCRDPSEILQRLNFIVKTLLKQDTDLAVSDDGLDAAVVHISLREKKRGAATEGSLTFAGARLPLIHVRGSDVGIVRGDRQSLGYKRSDLSFTFANHTVPIENSMSFYLSTDGFWDQLGKNEKKTGKFPFSSFGKDRFAKLLGEIGGLPFEEQRERLVRVFDEHRGGCERQDDVTVVGFGFREP